MNLAAFIHQAVPTVAVSHIQSNGQFLLRNISALRCCSGANLLHCWSPFICASSTRPEAALLIPSVFNRLVLRDVVYNGTMRSRLSLKLILLTTAITSAQLIWFGTKAIHQIDFDGMAYTGIAAELRSGELQQSINAFRSPLLSWLIAAIPYLTEFQAGKLISILTFISVLFLTYMLAMDLWHSREIAAIAVLLLSVARGLDVLAVAFVTPDFLLTALTAAYFITLLRSLRDERRNWWSIGLWHGIAFLAKAIALPWLSVCTCTAALFANSSRRLTFARIASALAIPIFVAVVWASVLHGKYGVFTTGSQFKANLCQWTLKGIVPKPPSEYGVLTDVSLLNDEHMVTDPMPPGWPLWKYHPPLGLAVQRILDSEIRNFPKAAKELAILLTPGVVVAFFAMTFVVLKSSLYPSSDRAFAASILIGSGALLAAYSMLAIDGRYLLPLLPLWLAFGTRLLLPDVGLHYRRLCAACWVLVISGVVFSLVYHASPLRVQRRDWQILCYRAGDSLKKHYARTVVSIGSGPYPEYGVGWEAGYNSSYFGQARLIATAPSVPKNLAELSAEILRASPDAVEIWSADKDGRLSLEWALMGLEYRCETPIYDPLLGNIGTIFFRDCR
ncbi:MAG: glycosyltransferase family 39 protein [Candidatus Sulfotelmatobacter sp.]